MKKQNNIGKEMLKLQDELAQKYKYKPLSAELSDSYREKYRETVPDDLNMSGAKTPLYSIKGTQLCKAYDRIVIGDYGAFIEISPEDMILNNICVKKGQEYRVEDEQYSSRVKYHWLTAKDKSDVKIYYQQRTVTYADYKPNKYYISPFEVSTHSLDINQNKEQNYSDKKFNTVVINAFGGAGAGKSTACLHIVAELKKRGYVAEYVSEYAKDLVWDKDFAMLDGSLKNQSLILQEQIKRVDRLIGEVQFAVTDSPILLNGVYLKDCPEKPQYCADILEKFNSYNNFNFVVKRDTSKYEQEGRIHSLEESIAVDNEVETLLKNNNLYFGTYDHAHLDTVVNNAIKTHQRIEKSQLLNDEILDLTESEGLSR